MLCLTKSHHFVFVRCWIDLYDRQSRARYIPSPSGRPIEKIEEVIYGERDIVVRGSEEMTGVLYLKIYSCENIFKSKLYLEIYNCSALTKVHRKRSHNGCLILV